MQVCLYIHTHLREEYDVIAYKYREQLFCMTQNSLLSIDKTAFTIQSWAAYFCD